MKKISTKTPIYVCKLHTLNDALQKLKSNRCNNAALQETEHGVLTKKRLLHP
uniref:Uncharacterized protein n=1 Tax=Arundo donax TaxID=35708 RepID=A0A0A9BNX9_ARUDO